jgi:hypothetical protein
MRFTDIRQQWLEHYGDPHAHKEALMQTLYALAEQEAIRESVPVQEPRVESMAEQLCPSSRQPMPVQEPAGPTLEEQIEYQRKYVAFKPAELSRDFAISRAILATLEAVQRGHTGKVPR